LWGRVFSKHALGRFFLSLSFRCVPFSVQFEDVSSKVVRFPPGSALWPCLGYPLFWSKHTDRLELRMFCHVHSFSKIWYPRFKMTTMTTIPANHSNVITFRCLATILGCYRSKFWSFTQWFESWFPHHISNTTVTL
jgi:hypothetical protein